MLASPYFFLSVVILNQTILSLQVDIALSLGTPFQIFHHHLIDMLDHILPRPEKRTFNCLSSTTAVLDFLQDRYIA